MQPFALSIIATAAVTAAVGSAAEPPLTPAEVAASKADLLSSSV